MSTTNMTLTEAMKGLTVAEVRTIERHFGRTFDSGDLSGTDLTVAVIWAHERRRLLGQEDRPNWESFDDWTLGQLEEYFRPEEFEIDPSEPEGESGKDSKLSS